MTPGGDPVIVALMQQIDTVNAVLARMRVAPPAYDDLRQEAVIRAWNAARRGLLAWRSPLAVRAFLRIATARAVYSWWEANPPHVELRSDEATVPSAEDAVIARSVLRFMRQSTTPARWRALRAYALGTEVHAIARREHVPIPSIYDRIRRARLDIAAAMAREDAAIYVRRKKG